MLGHAPTRGPLPASVFLRNRDTRLALGRDFNWGPLSEVGECPLGTLRTSWLSAKGGCHWANSPAKLLAAAVRLHGCRPFADLAAGRAVRGVASGIPHRLIEVPCCRSVLLLACVFGLVGLVHRVRHLHCARALWRSSRRCAFLLAGSPGPADRVTDRLVWRGASPR